MKERVAQRERERERETETENERVTEGERERFIDYSHTLTLPKFLKILYLRTKPELQMCGNMTLQF